MNLMKKYHYVLVLGLLCTITHAESKQVTEQKKAYPNEFWSSSGNDSQIPQFISKDDLAFATLHKPFPVRVKIFMENELSEGHATGMVHTEIIDCKNKRSQPVNRVYIAQDNLFSYNHNPQIIKIEILSSEWRNFNTKNQVFTGICDPLLHKSIS